MFWLFLASAIFGGAFVVPMIMGGLDSEADLGDGLGEGGIDVDGDLEAAGDAVDVGGSGGGPLEAVLDGLLSFRSLVFFATFFGLVGLVILAFDYAGITALIVAVLIGLFASLTNSAVYGFLKATEPNSQMTDRSYIGRPAVVTIPIRPGGKGKIRITMDGQPQLLVATSYNETAEPIFDVGASVVVVQIERGTALVAAFDNPSFGEEL